VHGVMTYHMALQIGLRHMPSARLALANIGVDKDPNKAANVEKPGTEETDILASGRNRCKGRANYYHFNRARADELKASVFGAGDSDEKAIGALLHTTMDVGVRRGQGPHAGGVNNHATDGMYNGVPLMADGSKPPWSSVNYDQPWRFEKRYRAEVHEFVHILDQLRWNKYRERPTERERAAAAEQGYRPLTIKDKNAGESYAIEWPRPRVDPYDQELRLSFEGHVDAWNKEVEGSGGPYGRSSDEWYPIWLNTDPSPRDRHCKDRNTRDCREWDLDAAKEEAKNIKRYEFLGCSILDEDPRAIQPGMPM